MGRRFDGLPDTSDGDVEKLLYGTWTGCSLECFYRSVIIQTTVLSYIANTCKLVFVNKVMFYFCRSQFYYKEESSNSFAMVRRFTSGSRWIWLFARTGLVGWPVIKCVSIFTLVLTYLLFCIRYVNYYYFFYVKWALERLLILWRTHLHRLLLSRRSEHSVYQCRRFWPRLI